MLFNTAEFIYVFLPVAVVLHFIAARRSPTAAIVVTTLTSLFFYAWWKPPFVLLPVLSILGNLWIARRIAAASSAEGRRLMLVGIAANLAVLAYFKYFDLAMSVIEGRAPRPPDVPLALSFTTFVQIAFLVGIWRQPAALSLPKYAMFVAFFPHLIAGPIVRWNELGPQLADRARYRVDWENIALGLTVFCFGLAKKVLIADKLAPHVNTVFDAASRGDAIPIAVAWGAAFAYSAQLYFDFSGYSDMAIGLGLLFNLRLPLNFAAPFRATSIIDLWRRWHITLSRFLRDFVYVPLGGSQSGPVRRSFNLVATMSLGGLWHGANWTFLTWGLFHGVLLAINHAWRTLRGPREATALKLFLGWATTFLAFVIGMVIFRASDMGTAVQLLQTMAGLGSPASVNQAPWVAAYWSTTATVWTVTALAIALLLPDTMEIVGYDEGEPQSDWRQRMLGALKWRPSAPWLVAMAALFVWVFANLGGYSEFLYYQF
jgi:alginate O-acetyltransferase complex protein AlgI